MTDVTRDIEVKNESADAYGWNSYEIWHNGKRIGNVSKGNTVVTDPDYVARGIGKRAQILLVSQSERAIREKVSQDRSSDRCVQDPKGNPGG